MRYSASESIEIDLSHEETKPAAVSRDHQQVSNLVDHIFNKITETFDVTLQPVPPIYISTGFPASRFVFIELYS